MKIFSLYLYITALLFALSALFIASTVQAQDTTTTIVKVVPPASAVAASGIVRNIIKIEPLLLLNGDLPLMYEYFIFNTISLEGGVGLTFKDFIRSYADFNDLLSESPKGEGGKIENSKLGASVRLGVRIYTTSKAEFTSRPYLQLQVQAKSYNWVSSYQINTAPTVTETSRVDESRNYVDFNLLFGTQKVHRSNIALDFYAGIGVRSRWVDRHKIVKFTNEQNQELTRLDTDQKSDLTPNLLLGIKLGYAF